ncbi:MAG TPA: DUF2459 domain-containing protein [Magnetospirillum sp.]|nr:DUF2459 domain-containing protein [Magnetospirillum sp.]
MAVIERGWHTDIGLPVDQLSAPLARLALDYPGAQVLEFGFGDRAFYMAREENLNQALAALFPGPGAILLTALRVPAPEAFGAEHVVVLRLSPAGFDGLSEYVWQALAKQADGTPLRIGDGPYPGSAFYAASQTYNAFFNCNAWTAEALSSGNLPIEPHGVLFADQLMSQARHVATRQREGR